MSITGIWIFFKDILTEYIGQSSALREISASIVQGSSIGPAMYVVEAADLHTVTPGNLLSMLTTHTPLSQPVTAIPGR